MLGKGRTEHFSVFRSSSRSNATHSIGELKNFSPICLLQPKSFFGCPQSKIKNVCRIPLEKFMRVQNNLDPIMPATSSQCYAVCSTSCGMYYNLCWELLAKWAINQLQLCLLVQCTFAIQYQMQQINISYFLLSFSYTYPNSFMVDYIPRGMATIHNKAISQVL